MGGNFFYDEMHAVPQPEKQPQGTERQLEVFTHSQAIFLRLGPVGERDAGTDRYTAQLTAPQARKLIEGIEGALRYLGESVS